MINLPKKLIDEAFDKNICQGTVIYYVKLPLTVEVKNKFLVLLNRDCSQPDIYYFLSTSQTKFYESHRKLRNFFVFIPKNTVPFFPLVTLIDCRNPYLVSRNKLREKYGNHELNFKGILPAQFMNEVIRIVRKSPLISRKIKKLILPT